MAVTRDEETKRKCKRNGNVGVQSSDFCDGRNGGDDREDEDEVL